MHGDRPSPPFVPHTTPQSASNATSRPPSEKKPGELVILSGPLSVFLRPLSVVLPRTSVYSVLICVQAVLRKCQNSQTWKSVNSSTNNFLPRKDQHKSPKMNVKCLNLAAAHVFREQLVIAHLCHLFLVNTVEAECWGSRKAEILQIWLISEISFDVR